jgi:hypothetical protein
MRIAAAVFLRYNMAEVVSSINTYLRPQRWSASPARTCQLQAGVRFSRAACCTAYAPDTAALYCDRGDACDLPIC